MYTIENINFAIAHYRDLLAEDLSMDIADLRTVVDALRELHAAREDMLSTTLDTTALRKLRELRKDDVDELPF